MNIEWEFLGSKLEHGENQNDLMKKICKALNGSPAYVLILDQVKEILTPAKNIKCPINLDKYLKM